MKKVNKSQRKRQAERKTQTERKRRNLKRDIDINGERQRRKTDRVDTERDERETERDEREIGRDTEREMKYNDIVKGILTAIVRLSNRVKGHTYVCQ